MVPVTAWADATRGSSTAPTSAIRMARTSPDPGLDIFPPRNTAASTGSVGAAHQRGEVIANVNGKVNDKLCAPRRSGEKRAQIAQPVLRQRVLTVGELAPDRSRAGDRLHLGGKRLDHERPVEADVLARRRNFFPRNVPRSRRAAV